MSTSFLLETYAKRLRLPAIKRVYKEIAHDAAERQIPYEEFLLALLEQFEFSAMPSLNKPKLLQLARCEYIEKAENIMFIGNSGTGKT
ncbi:ATP-binding protein, partial [Brevibacillus panacihumi]|uniref:ATP-binding protein n=1 Tax=Brevibacillus panacihumi TaxID=497735 RepID=UPI003D0311F8